jgi:hypothetical protein
LPGVFALRGGVIVLLQSELPFRRQDPSLARLVDRLHMPHAYLPR